MATTKKKEVEIELTVRQYCYSKNFKVENKIKSQERVFKEEKKKPSEWVEILKKKGLNF